MKSNKIKEYRRKANLTQEELGVKIGMSQEAVAQYESGSRTPNIFIALRISKALGASLESIFVP